jgi:hypothetical protein
MPSVIERHKIRPENICIKPPALQIQSGIIGTFSDLQGIPDELQGRTAGWLLRLWA